MDEYIERIINVAKVAARLKKEEHPTTYLMHLKLVAATFSEAFPDPFGLLRGVNLKSIHGLLQGNERTHKRTPVTPKTKAPAAPTPFELTAHERNLAAVTVAAAGRCDLVVV